METHNTSEEESNSKRKKHKGYIFLILGILVIGFGVFLHIMETSGNDTELNLIIALIYEYLGMTGVIIIGGLMIYDGIKALKKKDTQHQKESN